MKWERGIPEDKDLKMVRPFVLAPPAPSPPEPPSVSPAVTAALAACAAHGAPSIGDLERILTALRARATPPLPLAQANSRE